MTSLTNSTHNIFRKTDILTFSKITVGEFLALLIASFLLLVFKPNPFLTSFEVCLFKALTPALHFSRSFSLALISKFSLFNSEHLSQFNLDSLNSSLIQLISDFNSGHLSQTKEESNSSCNSLNSCSRSTHNK